MQPVRVRYTGTPRSPEESEQLLALLAIGLERLLKRKRPEEIEERLDLSDALSVHSNDREDGERKP